MKKKSVNLIPVVVCLVLFSFVFFVGGSDLISRTYNYSSQAILNQTSWNQRFVHLEVNNTANRYASFDGVNGHVSIAGIQNLSGNNITFGGWINKSRQVTNSVAMGRITVGSAGYMLYTEDVADTIPSCFFYGLSPNHVKGITNLSLNSWDHYMCQYNGTNLNIYKNGVLERTVAVMSGTFVDSTNNLAIGVYGISSSYWNGSLDDMMLFNGSLTSTEIATIYALNRSRYNLSISGLVGQWDFNDGINNYQDKSGNGKHGTGVGNVFTTTETSLPHNSPYDSLVGYWSFDGDNNITAYDLSGNARHGTYASGGFSSPGLYGNAGVFRGFDASVSIANHETIRFRTRPFYVGFWIKAPFNLSAETIQNFAGIVTKGSSAVAPAGTWGFHAGSGSALNSLNFYASNTSEGYNVIQSWSIPPNSTSWHYVSANRISDLNFQFYLNGVNFANRTSSGASLDLNSTAILTFARDHLGRSMNVSLDEVMIFNRALTPAEITAIYNNQSRRFKSEGTITPSQIALNNSGYSQVRLNISVERLFNTGVVARLGHCDNSSLNCSDNANYTFTDEKTLDSSGSTTFNIPLTTTNLLPEFKMFANTTQGNVSFYSPLMFASVSYELSLLSLSFSANTTQTGNWLQDWIFAKLFNELEGTTNITLWNSTGLVSSSSLIEYNFTSLDDGTYYLNATILDSLGQTTNSETKTIILDTTPPEIEIVSPENNSWQPSSFLINTSFSDLYLKNVSYNFNNSFDSFSYANFTKLKPVEELMDGLVGFWNADGNAVDSSGNGNNGTLVGNANASASGVYGNAFGFDGAGDYVNISNKVHNFNESYSVSFWARPQISSSHQMILSAGGSNEFYISLFQGTTLFISHLNSTGGQKIASYWPFSITGEWNYYTIVSRVLGNTVNQSAYRNGVLVYSYQDTQGTYPYSQNILWFGKYGGEGHYLNGSLDEVMIFNRSISQEEIQQIYYSQLRKFHNENPEYSVAFNQPMNSTNGNARANLTSHDVEMKSFNLLINQSQNVALAEGFHSYTLSSTDLAGNTNTASANVEIDTVAPKYYSLTYTPNYEGDIDPKETITFQLNVTDERTNVSSVILQLHNDTASEWLYLSMERIGGDVLSGIYQYNFTTSEEETNYTFNIRMNDSVGNVNTTSNTTFKSEWDCTWNISTEGLTGSSAFGFDEVKAIGNITIINQGDVEYNRSGEECVLRFAIEYNQTLVNEFSLSYLLGTITEGYNPGLRFNDTTTWTTPFTLSVGPEQNKTISIAAAFHAPISPMVETPVLLLTSNVTDTIYDRDSETITLEMTIAQPGAFLRTPVISEQPSAVVYLTEQNLSFKTYTENMGGDGSDNYTAYNVTLNWAFPDGFTFSEDSNLSLEFENMSLAGVRYHNNVTTIFNNTTLPSFEQGYKTIRSYAFGYENITGSLTLIDRHVGNKIFLNNSIGIFFSCYNASDGVCVESCASFFETEDSDCNYCGDGTCAGIETCSNCPGDCGACPASTSSGGSGGGRGGLQEQSEAQFEFVFGVSNEFKLPIKNKYPSALVDVRVTVTGENSEFVSISPSVIPRIEGNSEENITVTINAPAYFREGEYQLRFRIEGFVLSNNTRSPYSESKLVTLFVLDLSRADAALFVENSKTWLDEMNEKGLFTRDLEKLLKEIETTFNETKFSTLKRKFEEFKLNYDSAIEGLRLLEELRKDIAEAERNGINVFESKKLMLLGEQAMNRGAFIQALDRFKESKLTYAAETKGEFNLYYYVKNNPLDSLGILIGASLVGYAGNMATKYKILTRRLKLLKQEQALLLGLMKIVQRECFELAHMSMDEYASAMAQYESRLQKSVELEVRTETQLAHLGRARGKKKALVQEKERLYDLVRAIQTKYLIKGEMETRIYENMMKSYSRRFTEVEEELVFLEAKEFLRKRGQRL